jgi:hypothetical protein
LNALLVHYLDQSSAAGRVLDWRRIEPLLQQFRFWTHKKDQFQLKNL